MEEAEQGGGWKGHTFILKRRGLSPLPLIIFLTHSISSSPKMASLIGVSSIYQTPALELYQRPNATSTSSVRLQCLDSKSHFNNLLRAHRHSPGPTFKTGLKPTPTFLPSAIATPNSSLLSEEAFKGLGRHFDQTDHQFEHSSGSLPAEPSNSDELDISKLDLPSRLVDSLKSRGITHLFPIQVRFSSYLFTC